MQHFARPLNSVDLANKFLVRVLGVNQNTAGDLALKIRTIETMLHQTGLKSTFDDCSNRHPSYSSDDARNLLREKILYELIDEYIIDDEEHIKLGKGGAKPPIPLSDKKVVILTGLPASGKSTLANVIAKEFNSYLIDSDIAKRKFPEFQDEFGASLVHREASDITFGGEQNLQDYCINNGYNMVIPTIGNNVSSLRELRDEFIEKGFKVHLILVSLEREKACDRALKRFMKTTRYVPLSLIFDGYANDPILSYYRIKNDSEWESVSKVSSDCSIDKGFVSVEYQGKNNPITRLADKGIIHGF